MNVEQNERVILFDVNLDAPNIQKVHLINPLTNSENGAPLIGVKLWAGRTYFDVYHPLNEDTKYPIAWFKRADGKTVKISNVGGVGTLDNYMTQYDSTLQKNISQCVIIKHWPSACFAVLGPFQLTFDVYVEEAGEQTGHRRSVIIIEGNVVETKTGTLITM